MRFVYDVVNFGIVRRQKVVQAKQIFDLRG